MRFEDSGFAPVIKKNLASMGFRRPTDIQFKAIPPILKGEDVLAIAQTGTGKTAAFVIPVVNNLLKEKNTGGIRCLVMVPTRELGLQIAGVFEEVSKDTGLKTLCVYGGVEQDPQIRGLAKGTDILVATPGRMFDLASQGFIRLDQVKVLILDEADHMLDLGFINDIRQLVSKLPKRRQTLFFSATIDHGIKKLAYSMVRDAIRIQISPKDPVSKNIDHFVTFIEMDDKRFFLERIIREHPESKILVFVRTKVRAERVGAALERVEIKSITMHGDKDQKEREQALGKFRKGEINILIATDVTARGIDIPNVEYVINYDLPEKAENYVHRVGRTGRATKRGIAISFCSEGEKPVLEEIQSYLEREIEVLKISKKEYAETIDLSTEGPKDWRKLIEEAEREEEKRRKKKKG
ncbi:MAG TPA: DEAD/DEAH box helicase [Lentimicrobium sp.]|nr:DEAD/DEAH box helicase [Lentimicrobium sp.]